MFWKVEILPPDDRGREFAIVRFPRKEFRVRAGTARVCSSEQGGVGTQDYVFTVTAFDVHMVRVLLHTTIDAIDATDLREALNEPVRICGICCKMPAGIKAAPSSPPIPDRCWDPSYPFIRKNPPAESVKVQKMGKRPGGTGR